MQYFGHGHGNDLPIWQADIIPQLDNTFNFFEFCTTPEAAPVDPTVQPVEETDPTAVDGT